MPTDDNKFIGTGAPLDCSVTMYAGPPSSGTSDDPPWYVPKVGTLPFPEEMRRIALESAMIQDLLKRVQKLEKEVEKLKNKK